MKAELEDRLAEEFELYNMCKEIAEVLETAEKPVHIVVDQIKEKYRTLRTDRPWIQTLCDTCCAKLS